MAKAPRPASLDMHREPLNAQGPDTMVLLDALAERGYNPVKNLACGDSTGICPMISSAMAAIGTADAVRCSDLVFCAWQRSPGCVPDWLRSLSRDCSA